VRGILLCFTLVLTIVLPFSVLAIMSSNNYYIEEDSVNMGGRDDQYSANYQLRETIAGTATGIFTSSNYMLGAGYQQMIEEPQMLSFNISNEFVDLETIGPGFISSDYVVLSITTNSEKGYVIALAENHNLKSDVIEIADVTDGEVSPGHEEYGIRTSGSDGQMNDTDTAITEAFQTIASANNWVNNSQTMVTYKASVDPLTPAGQYNHFTIFICTVRY